MPPARGGGGGSLWWVLPVAAGRRAELLRRLLYDYEWGGGWGGQWVDVDIDEWAGCTGCESRKQKQSRERGSQAIFVCPLLNSTPLGAPK